MVDSNDRLKLPLLDAYSATVEEMNALPELIFKMRHKLRKYGAIQIISPLQWRAPALPVIDETRMKTQEQYLHIAPFARKSVLSVVEEYQAASESVDHVELQDEDGKISECAVVLRTRTTTVKLH